MLDARGRSWIWGGPGDIVMKWDPESLLYRASDFECGALQWTG